MTKAVIGNGVKELSFGGYDLGRYDKNLSSADGVFQGCVSLSAVTIGNGIKSIGLASFANTALTEVNIPDNVITVDKGAFYDCDALQKVKVGGGVTTIGDKAFYDCNSLTEIQLGTGIVAIGAEAFRTCTKLKKLNLPSNVTSLGEGLCAGDTSLQKVIIGNGITELKAMAGQYSDNPDSLRIGADGGANGTFEGCVSLEAVAMGNGLTTIGVDTFSNTSIKTLFIPQKVKSIGDGAFYNSLLEKLYFVGSAPDNVGTEIYGTMTGPALYIKLSNKSSFGFDDKVSNVYEFTPITVKFDSNGVVSTLANDQLLASEGGYVIEPIPLAAENYLFLGWYTDKEGTKKWDFMNDEVTTDTTLYAKWISTSEAKPEMARISDVYETTARTAEIQWQEVSGAKKYNVYQDGQFVGTVTDGTCKYELTNLEPDTSYEITVTALNDVGESEQSLVKVIQTAEKDEEPDPSAAPNASDNPNPSANPGTSANPRVAYTLGDIDNNGDIDLLDVQAALATYLGNRTLTDVQWLAANVNEDEDIDLQDVQMILQYYLGNISRLGKMSD